MGREQQSERGAKISQGIKRSKQAKKDLKEKQDYADAILSGFESGAGKGASKFARLDTYQEFIKVNGVIDQRTRQGSEKIAAERRDPQPISAEKKGTENNTVPVTQPTPPRK